MVDEILMDLQKNVKELKEKMLYQELVNRQLRDEIDQLKSEIDSTKRLSSFSRSKMR